MTDKHLGDRVHALLDGRLSRDDAHAAMAHLAECEECDARWQELRAAREALNSSPAGIDMGFARLLLDCDRMAQIAKGESKHVAKAARGRDRRPTTIAVALAIIVGITVGAAYLAGMPDTVPANLVAIAASGDDGSSAVMDDEPMGSSATMAAWVQPDWQDSGLIPVEAKIMRHRGATILVASMLVGLDPVVVVEQHGRMAHEVRDLAPQLVVNGVVVYVVSVTPIQVLWESGPVVMAATCTCAVETLATAIAAFPHADAPGVMDQIGAGLSVFGDALTGH